jgi:hypothetical protein
LIPLPKRDNPHPPPAAGDLWPCFVCAARDVCAHREPALALWLASIEEPRRRRAIAYAAARPLPPRKPPARATNAQLAREAAV